MKYLRLEEKLLYDGSQIEPQWAFRTFKIKDSTIVSWIGPMDIKQENIVDYEDKGKHIKGNKLLHFIIEHFECQPADIRLCYHRQRLFIMIVRDNLEKINIKTLKQGDDLYCNISDSKKGESMGKLSVSIATCSINSMKIHFAMNIVNEGTPTDVEITSLTDLSHNLTRKKIIEMADNICEDYINELSTIEEDITKTKVF